MASTFESDCFCSVFRCLHENGPGDWHLFPVLAVGKHEFSCHHVTPFLDTTLQRSELATLELLGVRLLQSLK